MSENVPDCYEFRTRKGGQGKISYTPEAESVDPKQL